MTARLLHVSDRGVLNLLFGAISSGESVVIPTETIWGLTANALDDEAVRGLYEIKGRSMEKVSAIFLPSIESISRYGEIEFKYAEKIINHYLPGPLTIVLRSKVVSWRGVVGGDGKIGIRVSSDSFVRNLAERIGKPLIATSANRSGMPDCGDLETLRGQFAELVPYLVYRDISVNNEPSTVVDLSGNSPIILREGAIAGKEILTFLKQ